MHALTPAKPQQLHHCGVDLTWNPPPESASMSIISLIYMLSILLAFAFFVGACFSMERNHH